MASVGLVPRCTAHLMTPFLLLVLVLVLVWKLLIANDFESSRALDRSHAAIHPAALEQDQHQDQDQEKAFARYDEASRRRRHNCVATIQRPTRSAGRAKRLGRNRSCTEAGTTGVLTRMVSASVKCRFRSCPIKNTCSTRTQGSM